MNALPTILYVAGSPRSGTTLLGNVLGQVDGHAMVGEVYRFGRCIEVRRLCGCGELFTDCSVWQPALLKSGGPFDHGEAVKLENLRQRITRTRHLPRFLHGDGWTKADDIEEYSSIYRQLYPALQEASGGAALVDTSKSPIHAAILARVLQMNLTIIHVTRDPRAVAHSWSRKKRELSAQNQRAQFPRHGPVRSAAIWATWNAAIEAVARRFRIPYRRVRYEDFVADPARTLVEILGPERGPFSFIREGHVRLESAHSAAGNPSRFSTGNVPLRLDREWESKMSRGTKLRVAALVWPLMLRYGYA